MPQAETVPTVETECVQSPESTDPVMVRLDSIDARLERIERLLDSIFGEEAGTKKGVPFSFANLLRPEVLALASDGRAVVGKSAESALFTDREEIAISSNEAVTAQPERSRR